MPLSSSRYTRHPPTSGFRLEARDLEILRAILVHRYLSVDHVRHLFFACRSLRAVQARMRKLWVHGLLDRRFRPPAFIGAGVAHDRRPLYALARPGAEVLAEAFRIPFRTIPYGRNRTAEGFHTLSHHLVVTDLLVALTAACRDRVDIELVTIARETELRRATHRARQEGRWRTQQLMSDGAFTLRYPTLGRTVTFHIEVVRAGVKGGNRRLQERLERYVTLNRARYFRTVFGQEHLRAVLVVTTSAARAERFRRLAESLAHGRHLFWFTHYEEKQGRARSTRFTPTSVLTPLWRASGCQTPVSLLLPDARALSLVSQ